ncbi:MAG: serine O-acetyltransferase, partial [Chloroflexota bacterium]|nr:serine O-acetyltransferase [Chloroflexota bacterium]
VVVGETVEIGDDVLMYKGVVLGGVSNQKTKRHPTVGNHVVLGSDAIVLGPITIGDGSKIGSGSVVVNPVPAGATVVGVPGRVVKINGVHCRPDTELRHERLPDPMQEALTNLNEQIEALERRLSVVESGSHSPDSPAKAVEEIAGEVHG